MLHGKIEVNGIAVGYWEALRTDPVFEGMNHYECQLFYRNSEGHPLHAQFTTTHFEKNGAVGLASLVLRTGMRNLKGYAPGQDTEFPI